MYNYVSVPFGIFAGTITSRVNPSNSMIKSQAGVWSSIVSTFLVPSLAATYPTG
jgi:hypothetical protein